MTDINKELREIAEELFSGGTAWIRSGKSEKWIDICCDEAIAKIKALVVESIGEDEHENMFAKDNPLYVVRQQYMWNRNELRGEIRSIYQ